MAKVNLGHKAEFDSFLLMRNFVSVKIFWNLVCKDDSGYEIVIDEYTKNAHLINEALDRIKDAYLPSEQ